MMATTAIGHGSKEGKTKMSFLTQIWGFLLELPPLIVIPHYEAGVRLRLGHHTASLGPGLHWRVPGVHKVLTASTMETVADLTAQVVQDLAIEANLRYRMADAGIALLEVTDWEDSLYNLTAGTIAEYILRFPDRSPLELRGEIFSDVRDEAEIWGVEVISLKFSTYTRARTFRLLQDGLL